MLASGLILTSLSPMKDEIFQGIIYLRIEKIAYERELISNTFTFSSSSFLFFGYDAKSASFMVGDV